MPTYNQYSNKSGYYIRARVSDSKIITYQIKPVGEKLLERVGYVDEDNFEWQVIRALKIAGLIYTGEGGIRDTTSISDDVETSDSLSKQKAQKLFDQISSIPQVGNSKLTEIRDLLNISRSTEFDVKSFSEQIHDTLCKAGTSSVRQEYLLRGRDEMYLWVKCEDRCETEQYIGSGCPVDFELTINVDPGSQETGWLTTRILLNTQEGVISCQNKVNSPTETHEKIIQYHSFLNTLLDAIVIQVENSTLGT